MDGEGLKALALAYVGRYATSRAKLGDYLRRKVKERGWGDEAPPAIEGLVARFAELGYVDDRAFAASRAASLGRRGYGGRRINQALHAAGIEAEDRTEANEIAERDAREAALRFARRRRIGPFAAVPLDPAARRKALAAMLRAGHAMDLALDIIGASAEDVPELDGF